MTVEEYSKEVQELLKNNPDGYVAGVKLAKDSKIRMNISNVNGNPAIIFCETDDNLKPTKVAYCLELADIPTVRALQIWAGEALSILAHEELQKTDMKKIIDNEQ